MTSKQRCFGRGGYRVVLGVGAVILCSTLVAGGEEAETADPGPIPYGMQVVEELGLKPVFDEMGLTLSGWIDQSYTYNTDSPSDRLNSGRVFDDRSNDYRLNQILLRLERELSEGSDFDIGFKIEGLYGSDARFIHQAGLADNISDQTVQFDPVQFYTQFRLPVGNGVTVKAGKYATTLGAEVINSPENALFSRSILFGFAIPFTHTGVQVDYPINDNFGVYYGVVQGWDVWNDNNDAVSHMFGFSSSSPDGKWSHFVNLITGPEATGNSSDYRTVLDVVSTYLWSDKLSQTVNIDYGVEEGAAADGGTAKWWGIANYFTYTINPQLASTLRAEYFRDDDGTRLGISTDAYEVTWGLDIYPDRKSRNVRLRPEVRWDHTTTESPFNGGRDSNQLTLAMNMILTF